MAVSGPSFRLYNDIRAALALDQEAGDLLQQLTSGALDAPWRAEDGLLLHGKRVFIPAHGDLRHQPPYTAASVARAFFDGIVCLHGFPTSIVSDRDPVFTSNLWRDLFKLCRCEAALEYGIPSTDGWAVRGGQPDHCDAQQYAKRYYDGHHRDVSFAVGDWVLLCLLHRPMQVLVTHSKGKLRPRYAGPFMVLERIGPVAYRLQLLAGARLHDVFHVSQLKAYTGAPPAALVPLPPVQDGRLLPAPERVLRAQLRRGEWRVLVQWQGLPVDDATWEPLAEFKEQYPEVQLEDELFDEAGRDVMIGIQYKRRNRSNSG
ncbi:uncharacterized protein [Miscanthus floridulus]|uniref:uncharacterized protein n=1 Tax=Miscanthus floridulus TaxID=154761 RepID=UPI003457A035